MSCVSSGGSIASRAAIGTEIPILHADKIAAIATVPKEAAGRTVHVILEVTDQGKPPLTAYRRVILNVSGKPVATPAGEAVAPKEDLTVPITRLVGPPAKEGPWRFWRGINVGGDPTGD